MVASDAHGIHKRSFKLKEAYDQIESDFGHDKVSSIQQVAKDLLNGDPITYFEYIHIKKKKFGLF